MRAPLLLLPFLLALATSAPAERRLVDFRLKKDPRAPVRGWLVDYSETSFRFRAFGGRRTTVRWDALVAEDRVRLRRAVGLELSERAQRGLVRGHRLHFKSGGHADGLLVRVDGSDRHWLKREGALLPYPGDQVERVEEIDVKDGDVFSPEEIYERKLERTPPKTARQHRRLAKHMERVGNLERAREHYREALELEPGWADDLEERIAELDALLADREAAELVRQARRSANLDRDFERAREKVERFLREHPDRRRQGLAMLDAIAAQEHEERRRRFLAVKHEEFDRLVDRLLLRQPTLDEAQDWTRTRLAEELEERTRERLGLSEEEWKEFVEADPGDTAPHWASYGGGSFTVSKRARIGKTSKRGVRGDPESWWEARGDQGTRGSYLKAYAAERLPKLFEIVTVRLRDCPGCGGTGSTKHSSVNPLPGGGHDFRVTCRRCYGAKRDRAVAYR